MYTYYLPLENEEGERCFSVQTSRPLTESESERFRKIIAGSDQLVQLSAESPLKGRKIFVGPRKEIETPASQNIVNICWAIRLPVTRVEEFRIRVVPDGKKPEEFAEGLYDPLTESMYKKAPESFSTNKRPQQVRTIPVFTRGRRALIAINKKLGLGWDDWDLGFIYNLISTILRRDPTDVELFHLAQMNSEHCRHWFFKGIMVLNGVEMRESLMDLIRAPLNAQIGEGKTNSLVAFSDNSSAILGFTIPILQPRFPGRASEIIEVIRKMHIVWTAETHCFPTMISPKEGAATGIGGALRDLMAMRRAAIVGWTMCGYSTAELNLSGYKIPGERIFPWTKRYALPRDVLIKGSDGLARYGNEFGVPNIGGFTRTFDMLIGGERRAYVKPILYAAVGGFMTDAHKTKGKPKKGMIVVSIGGPAYPIGIGGGSASSLGGGSNKEKLDFDAVQRANACEERVLDEVVIACTLLGKRNPIVSIHDQGAGGLANVLTELVSPAGAKIDIRKVTVGDRTMGVLKIWCSEFQERNAVLVWPHKLEMFLAIGKREGLIMDVVGRVTGNGRIVLYDSKTKTKPVDLPLGPILEKVPRKKFYDDEVPVVLPTFAPPKNKTVPELLERIFRLPSVGSKNFLIRKKDRSVGGRVVRQQGCGPFQIPVADLGAVALSHRTLRGAASALGEQPIKMLVDVEAGVRMSAAEAITNIMWALISGGIGNLKASINWMWPAKELGEAVKMYRAAKALSKFLIDLRGAQPDGGKDSLTLLAKIGETIVKSPGTMVMSAYGPVSDVSKIVTPDIKCPGESMIGFVSLSGGKFRLGGSALAQSFAKIGNESPDADAFLLRRAFEAVQLFLEEKLILSGHDVSDGGLITTLAEMAMSGASGITVKLPSYLEQVPFLFAEELGFAFEFLPGSRKMIRDVLFSKDLLKAFGVFGETTKTSKFSINFGDENVISEEISTLRNWWERTSDRLEEEQMDKKLARQMARSPHRHEVPQWRLTFKPKVPRRSKLKNRSAVAVIRAKGGNGHREMHDAFHWVGFKPYDVTMSDIVDGRVNLDRFRGAAFVGGFSYGDVIESGRGQAALAMFNKRARLTFQKFFGREDNFALGVCNGCQFGTQLDIIEATMKRNLSGKFEHSLVTVRIEGGSIMFDGMEGSVLGIIESHGEGRFSFSSEEMLQWVESEGRVALRYTLPDGTPTEEYPFNPNGSPNGIAGVTTHNRRYLFMMPHPERLSQKVVWPWVPREWEKLKASPWLTAFANAFDWCKS